MITIIGSTYTVEPLKPVRLMTSDSELRRVVEQLNAKISEVNSVIEIIGMAATSLNETKLGDNDMLVNSDGDILTDGSGEVLLDG